MFKITLFLIVKIQIYFNQLMNKQNVAYLPNVILFGNKKEKSNDTCYSMYKS